MILQCDHLYICESHKNLILGCSKQKEKQPGRKKSDTKVNGKDHSSSKSTSRGQNSASANAGSSTSSQPRPSAAVSSSAAAVEPALFDWSKMPIAVLRRYRTHFKLPSQPGTTKAQLAQVRS